MILRFIFLLLIFSPINAVNAMPNPQLDIRNMNIKVIKNNLDTYDKNIAYHWKENKIQFFYLFGKKFNDLPKFSLDISHLRSNYICDPTKATWYLVDNSHKIPKLIHMKTKDENNPSSSVMPLSDGRVLYNLGYDMRIIKLLKKNPGDLDLIVNYPDYQGTPCT